MSVTPSIKREREIQGTIDGNVGVYARSVANADWRRSINFKELLVEANDRYCAFPFMSAPLGGFIIVLWSSGDAHAESDSQRMVRFRIVGEALETNADGTPRIVDFVTSANVNAYNFELLEDLMASGDVLVLKNYHIKRNSSAVGDFTVTRMASLVIHDGHTFVGTARPKLVGGTMYRTFTWRESSTRSHTALFSSPPNDQLNWTFISYIFSEANLRFNETDFAIRENGQWVAFTRESTDGSLEGIMYMTTSDDGGLTWAPATKCTQHLINGVQVRMEDLANGDRALMVGDRTGSSGITASGHRNSSSYNTTGVAIFILDALAADATEASWGWRNLLSGFFSTDGGQPSFIEISPNRVACFFYSRRRLDQPPGIYAAIFNTAAL